MLRIKKKHGKIVQAYKLGEENVVLEQLMKIGKIVDLKDGTYEVFSQEAVNSGSGHGQIASVGDWVRLDNAGYPYPSKDDWFRHNMRHISQNDYEQIPIELMGWTANMEICPEIEFLIHNKGLKLNENNFEKFFSAILWGNPEVADRNAVLVFYSISYDKGSIIDAEYNFVEINEFNRIYDTI